MINSFENLVNFFERSTEQGSLNKFHKIVFQKAFFSFCLFVFYKPS